MAQNRNYRMPSFDEQRAIRRRAEALRAETLANAFRALRRAVVGLFATPRSATN